MANTFTKNSRGKNVNLSDPTPEMQYVLDLITELSNTLESRLQETASKQDLMDAMSFLEKTKEEFARKDDVMPIMTLAEKASEMATAAYGSIEPLATKQDAANAAIRALADKHDDEDVTNLDTDHRAVVDAILQ